MPIAHMITYMVGDHVCHDHPPNTMKLAIHFTPAKHRHSQGMRGVLVYPRGENLKFFGGGG